MSDAARRRATYQDLLRVPDDRVVKIVDGELIVSPLALGALWDRGQDPKSG